MKERAEEYLRHIEWSAGKVVPLRKGNSRRREGQGPAPVEKKSVRACDWDKAVANLVKYFEKGWVEA